MTVSYAVTFEFDNRPPITHRSVSQGRPSATCCFRAMRDAQKVLKPIGWSSCVCVLLERLPDEAPSDV